MLRKHPLIFGKEEKKETLGEEYDALAKLATCPKTIYSGLLVGLQALAYDVFGPWSKEHLEVRRAARKYFSKHGGVDLLKEIYNTDFDSVLWEGASLKLHRLVVSCLWNFGEVDENRRDLLTRGCVELVLPALLNHDKKNKKLCLAALGFYWGMTEYSPIQEICNTNGVLDAIVNLLPDKSDTQATTFKVTKDEELIFVLGNLQLLLCNTQRQYEPTKDNHIIDKLLKIRIGSGMVDYFTCHCLATLLLTSPQKNAKFSSFYDVEGGYCSGMEEDTKEKIKERIHIFLDSHTPSQICTIETKDHYTWVKLDPFVSLTLSNIKEIYQLGVFSLANLSEFPRNVNLLNQETIHYILCLRWKEKYEEVKEYHVTLWKNLSAFLPPSLHSITQAHIRAINLSNEQRTVDEKIIAPRDQA